MIVVSFLLFDLIIIHFIDILAIACHCAEKTVFLYQPLSSTESPNISDNLPTTRYLNLFTNKKKIVLATISKILIVICRTYSDHVVNIVFNL